MVDFKSTLKKPRLTGFYSNNSNDFKDTRLSNKSFHKKSKIAMRRGEGGGGGLEAEGYDILLCNDIQEYKNVFDMIIIFMQLAMHWKKGSSEYQ